MPTSITIPQLQHITLSSQGLLQRSPFGKGKKGVVRTIEQLGFIQIDTLAIVERAHHHTLWTRNPDYQTIFLDDLVKERKIFEYWFHAAAYLPMQDFRFSLPQMLSVKKNKNHYYNAAPQLLQYVLDTIRAEGPKQARDFENESKKPGSWWNWKPAKIALERLFLQGDLMISERTGMQKTYDITERVLPENIDTTLPSPLELAEYLVKTNLRAYGFTTIKQITHLKPGTTLRKDVNTVLTSMIQEGSVQKITAEGLPPIYIHSEWLAQPIKKRDTNIQLLSPFDNAIIHRDRILQLFNYDFRLECYIPKEKRQYGYFCLPILFGNTFIGRMDCKAHRKEKLLEIVHLHIENPSLNTALWINSFVEVVKRFAIFNGCPAITLTKVSPTKFTQPLKRILKYSL